LVFSSRRQDTNGDGKVETDDSIHLYTFDLTSHALTQITFEYPFNLEPTWSPDGKQIAFVAGDDKAMDLFIINSDGTNLRQLTHTREQESEPAWSPDGNWIAYVQRTSEFFTECQVHLITPDGKTMQSITGMIQDSSFISKPEDTSPSWSPDGQFLMFNRRVVSKDNNDGVYLVDMKTKAVIKLLAQRPATNFWEPRWVVHNDRNFISLTEGGIEGTNCFFCIYELAWAKNNEPIFTRTREYVFNDRVDVPVWGPNGEWVISVGSKIRAKKRKEAMPGFDIVLVPLGTDFFAL
jgi:Tol biopolymer transport system component